MENKNKSPVGNLEMEHLQPNETAEIFVNLREEKKLLDEKLQKIMEKKKVTIGRTVKKDEIDDDPLFGGKNPFSGATEEAKQETKEISNINSDQDKVFLIYFS